MIYILLAIFFIGYFLYRDYEIRKVLANEFFVELAKGNKRYYRGWWKIDPKDYEKIALDPRTHEQIAREYKVSRSRIGAIKQDYYSKREQEGREIVQNYFKKAHITPQDKTLFEI